MTLSEFISSSAFCHICCNVVRVSFVIPLSLALMHNFFSDGCSAITAFDDEADVFSGRDLLFFIVALSN